MPRCDRCQGVNVRTNAPLASVVNRHGAGTTYCLARGNYTVTERVLLDPGDRVVGAGRGARNMIQAASGIGVMSGYPRRTRPGSSPLRTYGGAEQRRAIEPATARAGP